jgi:hypothetical protein
MAVARRYADALDNRREMDRRLRERGHDPARICQQGEEGPQNAFKGVCRNRGGDAIVGPTWTSSHSHATRDLRTNDCPGAGTSPASTANITRAFSSTGNCTAGFRMSTSSGSTPGLYRRRVPQILRSRR